MAERRTPRIGFIGIGIMGAPMVLRLLERGYDVACWNREPERADLVIPSGAGWLASPAAVRERSDIVMLCVLDDDAVEACCFGPEGIAAAPAGAGLLVDCSTINPDTTRNLAGRLRRQCGMAWVDAPISGGPGPAREGRLTILAGGDDEAFERARPVLADLSANLTHLGPLGSGQIAKIINQAIVGVNYVLMAEAVWMAEAAGIDASRLPDALAGGAADSRILQTIFPQMQKRDFNDPRAYARQLDKDLANIERFAGLLGVDVPLVTAAARRYHAFVSAGNHLSDSAAIVLHDPDRD